MRPILLVVTLSRFYPKRKERGLEAGFCYSNRYSDRCSESGMGQKRSIALSPGADRFEIDADIAKVRSEPVADIGPAHPPTSAMGGKRTLNLPPARLVLLSNRSGERPCPTAKRISASTT